MGSFYSNLKTLREMRGLTQEALGERLGLSKSTISMYENGNREPNFETVETIADYFNVSIAALMGDGANYDAFALVPDEAQLLEGYRKLSERGKQYIQQTMEIAAQSFEMSDSLG